MSIKQKIKQFQAEKHSEAEIEEFEKWLYQRVVDLPLYKLTAALFATGASFVGYLYNSDLKLYATADSDNKWVFASAADLPAAVRFTAYADSRGNAVVTAAIGSQTVYLNWRNITGAVKLYDSYDDMDFRKWNDTVFQIYSHQQEEFMGLKERGNKELYYRATVYDNTFEFHYIQPAALNEDERLIWNHYLKHYPKYQPEFARLG